MKQVFLFAVVSALATGSYILSFILSADVAIAYLILEVALLITVYVRLIVFDTDKDRETGANIEQSSIAALVAVGMFIGLCTVGRGSFHTSYAILVSAGCLAVSVVPFVLVYVPILRAERRIPTLVALLAATLVLGLYLQPPLEGVGRISNRVLEFLAWAFAYPTRGYLTGLMLVFLTAMGTAALVPATSERPWVATMLFKVTLYLSACSGALYLYALHSWLSAGTLTKWYVVFGWVPTLFTFFTALFAGALYERAYHSLNFKVAIVVFLDALFAVPLASSLGSWVHAAVLLALGTMCLVTLLYANEIVFPSYWGPQLKSDGPRLSKVHLEHTLIALTALLIAGSIIYIVLWNHGQPWLPMIVFLLSLSTTGATLATVRSKVPTLHLN